MIQCRLCKSNATKRAFSFPDHSIVHHLKHKANDLPSFTGDFNLYECLNCGFLFSPSYFAPSDFLYKEYITLSSQKPQIHAERLASCIRFFSDHVDPGILEIGCNDGSFIKVLQHHGFNRLSAVEPASDAFLAASLVCDTVINSFFTSEFSSAAFSKKQFDVVITRQVLEHIQDHDDFLEGIRYCLADNGLLIIEVPDHMMNYIYHDYSFWEEHINYFTFNTLSQLLNSKGFSVFYYESSIFSGQFLTVYCRKSASPVNREFVDADKIVRSQFINDFNAFKSSFHRFLEDKLKSFNSVNIYGAGCRSICLLDFLELSPYINFFIDDSPDKENRFIPGSNKKIVPYCESYSDSYLLMGVNAELESSVILKRKLKASRLCSILPPSSRLPPFWNSNPIAS